MEALVLYGTLGSVRGLHRLALSSKFNVKQPRGARPWTFFRLTNRWRMSKCHEYTLIPSMTDRWRSLGANTEWSWDEFEQHRRWFRRWWITWNALVGPTKKTCGTMNCREFRCGGKEWTRGCASVPVLISRTTGYTSYNNLHHVRWYPSTCSTTTYASYDNLVSMLDTFTGISWSTTS